MEGSGEWNMGVRVCSWEKQMNKGDTEGQKGSRQEHIAQDDFCCKRAERLLDTRKATQ